MNNPDSTPKISVLIADDHHLIRDALAKALGADQRFCVTTADSFASVTEIIADTGPIDVILLDIVMPGMKGLESVEDIVTLNTDGAVVVFSGNTAPDFTTQAIELGARGFIPKTLPLKSLSAAIHLIAMGQVFVPIEANTTLGDKDGDEVSVLTQRELSILNLVSDGMTNKEIAWKVGIVEVTVKMHMRSICIKLEAKNRAHAVILASKLGLLKGDIYLG
jgi:two-component system nitrate/nitrite response regulator NarP